MFKNVIEDIRASSEQFKKSRGIKKIFYLIFTQELIAVLIFRFGHWSHNYLKLPIIKQLFKAIYFFARKFSELILGIAIWPESEIGPGLRIEHYGGVYIKTKMGKNCRISQLVVIGHIGGKKGGGVPEFGDNVYVGAGAKILGDVKIGNNVIIGANSVVLKDIPNNAVAVGIPAKVVKLKE